VDDRAFINGRVGARWLQPFANPALATAAFRRMAKAMQVLPRPQCDHPADSGICASATSAFTCGTSCNRPGPDQEPLTAMLVSVMADEGQAKDYDFSGISMREHWQSEYEDMR
jgi:Patatin phospholipase